MTAAVAGHTHLETTLSIDAFNHWHLHRKAGSQGFTRRRSCATNSTRIAASVMSRKPRAMKSALDEALEIRAGSWQATQHQEDATDAYSSREDSTTSDDASSSSGWEEEVTPRPPDFVPSFGSGWSPPSETTPRPSFLVPKALSKTQTAVSLVDDTLKERGTRWISPRKAGQSSSESVMRMPYSSPIGLTMDAFATCNFDEEYPLFDMPVRKQMLKEFHRQAYRAELRLVLQLGCNGNLEQRTQMIQEHNKRMESLMHEMAGEMAEKQRKWQLEKRFGDTQQSPRKVKEGAQERLGSRRPTPKSKHRRAASNAPSVRRYGGAGVFDKTDGDRVPISRRGKPGQHPEHGVEIDVLPNTPGRWRRQKSTVGWRLPTSAETSDEEDGDAVSAV